MSLAKKLLKNLDGELIERLVLCSKEEVEMAYDSGFLVPYVDVDKMVETLEKYGNISFIVNPNGTYTTLNGYTLVDDIGQPRRKVIKFFFTKSGKPAYHDLWILNKDNFKHFEEIQKKLHWYIDREKIIGYINDGDTIIIHDRGSWCTTCPGRIEVM